MRARMALVQAAIDFEVREVVLRDKPVEMLKLSEKGEVPVLLVADKVIDESLDIMLWALAQSDEEGWLAFSSIERQGIDELIVRCEAEFKLWLDRYKYSNRQTEFSENQARDQALQFIAELETRLAAKRSDGGFLFGHLGLADVALLPFVRQFAHVDKGWFDATPYPLVHNWLNRFLTSQRFTWVMQKYPQWRPNDGTVVFSTGLIEA